MGVEYGLFIFKKEHNVQVPENNVLWKMRSLSKM
jgi:hypothetical protein